MLPLDHIRNFSIVAHIDHGKTTLSDRLIEATRTVEKREMREQLLDSMDLERERGITIKSHPVTMSYSSPDEGEYTFNLIDTPGHVDFSYEVSRSLAACEGALLLVDASQGIEAQTVANAHLAIEQGLVVVPIVNKIDLSSADVPGTLRQLEEILAIPSEEAIFTSAKNGTGIDETIGAVIERIPSPRWAQYEMTRILIFDCIYDTFKGVICFVRVFSGSIQKGDTVLMMNDGVRTDVKEVGIFTPEMEPIDRLGAGGVGFMVTSIKDVSEVRLGDTVTSSSKPALEMLPGYKEVRPMVFSGIYPLNTTDYEKLKVSIAKLRLNDAAFVFQSENSVALGFGFRCGFLGLLHMEIVMERIRREYGLNIISTYPSVVYRVRTTSGREIDVDNPVNLPDPAEISCIREPVIKATILIPNEGIGDTLNLILERRGRCDGTETIDVSRLILHCTLPLNEILVDFNDRLKSVTHGYGSMDYDFLGYFEAELVKLDILVNGEPVDAFSSIVPKGRVEAKGRAFCEKLKEILPRQLFKIAIQASVGSRVIARETLSALRKDVTAKCYGGDITRKRKLLERQREGKRRMKQVGSVSIPQDAFIDILKSI